MSVCQRRAQQEQGRGRSRQEQEQEHDCVGCVTSDCTWFWPVRSLARHWGTGGRFQRRVRRRMCHSSIYGRRQTAGPRRTLRSVQRVRSNRTLRPPASPQHHTWRHTRPSLARAALAEARRHLSVWPGRAPACAAPRPIQRSVQGLPESGRRPVPHGANLLPHRCPRAPPARAERLTRAAVRWSLLWRTARQVRRRGRATGPSVC
jgi:hypothetical protein